MSIIDMTYVVVFGGRCGGLQALHETLFLWATCCGVAAAGGPQGRKLGGRMASRPPIEKQLAEKRFFCYACDRSQTHSVSYAMAAGGFTHGSHQAFGRVVV